MRIKGATAILLGAALAAAGCPGRTEVRDDRTAAGEAGPAGAGVTADARPAERPPLDKAERPRFDPSAPAPCESHTACYLAAKEAHASGERAGYLLTVERCEHYRGRYQLEKFYGLCLLLLADAYRHLDNFAESIRCYRRFLDTQPDDHELTLQARADLDEVSIAAKTPFAYRDYLQAVSLLIRYGRSKRPDLLEQAERLLRELQTENRDWIQAEKVAFLLEQIAKVHAAAGAKANAEEGAEDGRAPDEEDSAGAPREPDTPEPPTADPS